MTDKGFKYVIVGCGRMGSAAAWYLANQPSTKYIRLVDRSNADNQRMMLTLNADSQRMMLTLVNRLQALDRPDLTVEYLTTDISYASFAERSLAEHKIIDDVDVCIAACGYEHHVMLADACVNAGVHMVDLGGNRGVVKGQKAMDLAAQQANVSIIPDCGLAPGLINILAMQGYRELVTSGHDSDIDIKMYVGGLPREPGTQQENPMLYGLTWSASGLINEYVMPGEEIIDGQIFNVAPLSRHELVNIPNGSENNVFEAFVTGGGSSNLPEILRGKVRSLSYKTLRYPGHMNIMLAFRQLGFFGKHRHILENELDANCSLSDNDDLVIAQALCSGTKRGTKKRFTICYTFGLLKDHNTGFSAMAQATGYSAAAVALMLADGTIMRRGVLEGEDVVDGNDMIKGLAPMGIHIKRFIDSTPIEK